VLACCKSCGHLFSTEYPDHWTQALGVRCEACSGETVSTDGTISGLFRLIHEALPSATPTGVRRKAYGEIKERYVNDHTRLSCQQIAEGPISPNWQLIWLMFWLNALLAIIAILAREPEQLEFKFEFEAHGAATLTVQ
jgi:hypothetical protein